MIFVTSGMDPFRVTVSGNIGCGKTSVLTKLQSEFPLLAIHPEPVDEWGPWLSEFYSNQTKHALGLQVKILSTYRQMDAKTTTYPVVYERSPLDSIEVFAKSLHRTHVLSTLELELLKELFLTCGWTPNVYIHLEADPITCMTRIKRRNRNAEGGVSMDYLTDLHDEYDRYVGRLEQDPSISTHRVNANASQQEVYEHVVNILRPMIGAAFR